MDIYSRNVPAKFRPDPKRRVGFFEERCPNNNNKKKNKMGSILDYAAFEWRDNQLYG